MLPYARPGIVGGCFLALGRALGETMAVTMLIGNAAVLEMLPFGRGYTIPSLLAQKLPSSDSHMEDSALIELSLLLFVLTILMNSLARVLIRRVGQANRQRKLPGYGPPAPHPAAYAAGSPKERKRLPTPFFVNRVMMGVLALCLILTCVPLFLILGYITYRGAGR